MNLGIPTEPLWQSVYLSRTDKSAARLMLRRTWLPSRSTGSVLGTQKGAKILAKETLAVPSSSMANKLELCPTELGVGGKECPAFTRMWRISRNGSRIILCREGLLG